MHVRVPAMFILCIVPHLGLFDDDDDTVVVLCVCVSVSLFCLLALLGVQREVSAATARKMQ